MTQNILATIAKENGVELSLYDHVQGFIDDNYKFIYVILSNLEVCPGGSRNFLNKLTIKKSVSAIMKKAETTNVWPEDYETNGARWISEIK